MNLTACCAKASTPTPVYLSTLQRAFFMGRRKDFDLHVHTHLYVEHEFTELDIPRLYRAVEILVARHAMLRAWVAQDTRLWVQHQVPVLQDIQDYSALQGDALSLALEGRRDSLYRVDGDVELVPNIQVAVTVLAAAYRVHINLDLLLLDGSSIRIVLHELSAIYDDITAPWPEKPLDFAHVAEQMAQLKNSQRYQMMLKFWFERLETLPPGPQLPLRTHTDGTRRSRLIRRKLIIGPERWALLATKASMQNVSATALIFSVFSWVLAYWSKQGHFSVTMLMYQIRNQNMGDLSTAVANFAGTLLMEVERKTQQSFVDFCKSIHAEIFRNATKSLVCGMEVLQERNRQDKSTFRAASPVAFVSMINELGNPVQPGRFQMEGDYAIAGGLETPQVLMDHQAISRPDGGVALNWDTMDSAFEPGVIDAMFAAYSRMLEALLSDVSGEGIWQKTYTDLRPEAQQIKHQVYNLSQAAIPQQHLHSLFFAQAAKTPTAPYLRFAADPSKPASLHSLSYGAVRALANSLARQLLDKQLQPGELVAVYLNKGWQQVVASLGILAAGGAYVPLDPRQPLARKQDILHRCACRLAVSQGVYQQDAALAGLDLLDLDALSGDDSLADLPPRQLLSDTAYVIFTSGSTGTPKGVSLDHTGPVNSILDINTRINLQPDDCLFGLSELNFDLSVYDIFGTAAAGASVLIPPEGAGRDPALCGRLVQAGAVTVWNSVPALAQLFADYHSTASAWPLRLFMLSGDWIPIGLPQQLQQLGELAVLSLGGATEASIWSIYYPVRQTRSSWKSIPYGYPMTNQSLYVLDQSLQPRPNQVPGELYIGGIGLAKGYWGDEEKTAQAFITHPVSGQRLYRTGDWGVMREAGYIDFLGREDGQVKVRGFRIELGEIEAVLQRHPSVQAAVAKVIGAKPQDAYLAAYVVLDAQNPPSSEALHNYLSAYVPSYMLPSRWVVLAAMPLSANGKINRAALPDPEPHSHSRNQAAPSSAMECLLAQHWCAILGLEQVRLGDHFFELGGNSFAAVRLVMSLSEQLGRDIAITQLVQAPILEDLAALLEAEQAQAFSHLVELLPQHNCPDAFWFHPSGGNVLCYQDLANSLRGRFNLIGVQAAKGAAQSQFSDFDAMLHTYLAAIRQRQPQGPYYLGGWSMGGVIAYAAAEALLQQGQKVVALWLLDSPAPVARAVPNAQGLLSWFLCDLLQLDELPALHSLANPHPELGAVLTEIQQQGLLPAGNLRGLEAIYACFSANIRLLHAYNAAPLSAAVPCLLAMAEQQVESRVAGNSLTTWRRLLPSQCREMHLACNHYGVVSAPMIARYQQQISSPPASVMLEPSN